MSSSAMQYKRDFLKANKCTVRSFERAYINFMEANPDEQAYRAFAAKWGITIYPGLGHSKGEAVLSVGIAVIGVTR